MPLFRRTSSSRSFKPIRLWLRLKRWLRSQLIRGFQLSHLDQLYAIVHDFISQTRVPIDPGQESPAPKWKKMEYGFKIEPKPELVKAEEEIFGKPQPKPRWWQFRKKKEQKKAPEPRAELIASSEDKPDKPEPDKPEPDKPESTDYKLY